MSNIERRVEKLEATMPSNDKYPVIIVGFEPWCSAGAHALPSGYLRGYQGYAQRKSGESEDDLHARALTVALEHRAPGCGIVLVEDREKVKCKECPDVSRA